MPSQRIEEALARACELGFSQSCDDDVGRLLSVLAAGVADNGRILEIGTGAGVGAAWIVDGLEQRSSVEFVTVENDAEIAARVQAESWPDFLRFEVGDALQLVPALGKFDLVFADAVAGKWFGLDVSIEALKLGGLIVVDDMQLDQWVDDEHREKTAEVRHQLVAHPRLKTVEISWSSGLVLATRFK